MHHFPLKVKMLKTARSPQRGGPVFYKGFVYHASLAWNQPNYYERLFHEALEDNEFDITKDISVKVLKVFVAKGKKRPDIDTLLLDEDDFRIVSMEVDSIDRIQEEIVSAEHREKLSVNRRRFVEENAMRFAVALHQRPGYVRVNRKEQSFDLNQPERIAMYAYVMAGAMWDRIQNPDAPLTVPVGEEEPALDLRGSAGPAEDIRGTDSSMGSEMLDWFDELLKEFPQYISVDISNDKGKPSVIIRNYMHRSKACPSFLAAIVDLYLRHGPNPTLPRIKNLMG